MQKREIQLSKSRITGSDQKFIFSNALRAIKIKHYVVHSHSDYHRCGILVVLFQVVFSGKRRARRISRFQSLAFFEGIAAMPSPIFFPETVSRTMAALPSETTAKGYLVAGVQQPGGGHNFPLPGTQGCGGTFKCHNTHGAFI